MLPAKTEINFLRDFAKLLKVAILIILVIRISIAKNLSKIYNFYKTDLRVIFLLCSIQWSNDEHW